MGDACLLELRVRRLAGVRPGDASCPLIDGDGVQLRLSRYQVAEISRWRTRWPAQPGRP